MLALGQMNRMLTFQNSVQSTDDMGGIVRSWVDYETVYGAIENQEYVADESNGSPHNSNTLNRTYIIRNHPSLNFDVKQRISDAYDGSLSVITAIRYDAKQTVCFVDATSGAGSV